MVINNLRGKLKMADQLVKSYDAVSPEDVDSSDIVDRYNRVAQLRTEILERIGVELDDYRIERRVDGYIVEELRNTDSIEKFDYLAAQPFVRVSQYGDRVHRKCAKGNIHELRLIRISDNKEVKAVVSVIENIVYSNKVPSTIGLIRL
jgi:hypothetical protein